VTASDLQKKNPARQVIGFLTLPDDIPTPSLPILGDVDDLEKILRAHVVVEVFIAGIALRSQSEAQAMQKAIKMCERFGVPFALPEQFFRFDRASPVNRIKSGDGYIHYLNVDTKPLQWAIKRWFDMTASATALWILSPLFLAVALLIKLTSRGPILFLQERVGLHGKTFYLFKFRSMVAAAETLKESLLTQNEQQGPVFKIKNDPRVTTIGRFIRRYSIDELPQLVNVLRGEMSVVGPRPPVPSEVVRYESWQRRRLSVRPGLTCIWQVSGRNEISFDEWMYLDMCYVDNWNLLTDFDLILKTFPVILSGRGAS